MVISKPTPKPFQPNTHSLSLNPLLSLSFLSALFPFLFYQFWFHINTPMIWWEVIIATNWLNLNRCFIRGLLTIFGWHNWEPKVFRTNNFWPKDVKPFFSPSGIRIPRFPECRRAVWGPGRFGRAHQQADVLEGQLQVRQRRRDFRNFRQRSFG